MLAFVQSVMANALKLNDEIFQILRVFS